MTWSDRLLTFGDKPARQPPVGNDIVRVLMIEARWAIRIVDDLRRAGHAFDGVLKEVGLGRADLATPEDRIPYAAYVGLIERAAALLGDPGYGLKLGASYGVRDIGLHGFIALNSPTLGDALASIERYVRVTNEGIDAVFEADGQGRHPALSRDRCIASRPEAQFGAGRRPDRQRRPGADTPEGDPGACRLHA